MAEDLDDGEFWLPSQFLTDEKDDLHHHHNNLLMNKIHSIRFGSYGGGVSTSPLLFPKRPSSPVEPAMMMMMMTSTTLLTKRDDDRENHHLTKPTTCLIPHSKHKERRVIIMSGSPKSPLCDIGNWSAFSCCSSSSGGGGSSRGSPICSSLVSSPPSSTTPHQNVKLEDPLDVLNAAAGQIGRLKLNEEEEEEEGRNRHNHHHSELPLEITTPPVCSKVKKLGLFSNQALIQKQLQDAHQFRQLKQQQQQSLFKQQQLLLRQQLSATWSQQGKIVPPALPQPQPQPQPQPLPLPLPLPLPQPQQQQVQSNGRCARPLGVASSLHQQQQGSGTSRESCGTGVFIPRRRSIPAAAETSKKPAGCPAVMVPAKVVQTPNSSSNAMGSDIGVLTSNKHVKCSSSIQQTRTASDTVILSGQQHQPQNVTSHEICLPKEWTY